MAYSSILIIDAQSKLFTLRVALEQRYNVTVSHARDAASGLEQVRSSPPEYILVNPNSIGSEIAEFLAQLAQMGKETPVIVAGNHEAMHNLRTGYAHIVGRVPLIYSEDDLLPFMQQQRRTRTGELRSRALAERAALVQANQMLEQRVQEAMTLYQIGKAVASLTDLDTILARITEAAVFLLQAEESSIMLADPKTNELYLRAQKGLGEKQAKGFNLKIEDTLIGSVVRTGQPVRLARGTDEDARLKVVTGYLVNALLYVPLTLREQVIGVLGVANQSTQKAFGKRDQCLMEALSNYAALAIEVARQHEMIADMRQDLTSAHIIAATIQELRQRLANDDPDTLDALGRIEAAAQTLTRLAETEAPVDV